jgi:hypothetical protein
MTAAGMGASFAMVGLDKADKLASVGGAFLGLAGFALAIYGTLSDQKMNDPPQQDLMSRQAPNAVHNLIEDGIFHGPVVQGGDIGKVSFGRPASETTPPRDPSTLSQPTNPDDPESGERDKR